MTPQPPEQPRTAATELLHRLRGADRLWKDATGKRLGLQLIGSFLSRIEAEAAAPDSVASPAHIDGALLEQTIRDLKREQLAKGWTGNLTDGWTIAEAYNARLPVDGDDQPTTVAEAFAVIRRALRLPVAEAAAPEPVASPLDVERLHRIIGYAGEGIPAWTHKPPPESRVPTFLAFNVRDVHAAINRWARLEGQPVAEEPRPNQEETP